MKIYFNSRLNFTCNVLHLLISDIQNKVTDLAFVLRKYYYITTVLRSRILNTLLAKRCIPE